MKYIIKKQNGELLTSNGKRLSFDTHNEALSYISMNNMDFTNLMVEQASI